MDDEGGRGEGCRLRGRGKGWMLRVGLWGTCSRVSAKPSRPSDEWKPSRFASSVQLARDLLLFFSLLSSVSPFPSLSL